MKQKRPFLPGILDDYDQQLLKNSPEAWSARTHLVVYYGLLFMAILAGICFIRPDDPRSESTVGYWITFVSIISIIAVVLWMIFLLRFNVFKRYGNITALGRLKTFMLYFISAGTIALFTYVPPVIESFLANNAYTSDELVNDANRVNSLVCQLAYDSLPHEWVSDTVVVLDNIYDENHNRIYPEVQGSATGSTIRIIDTADYEQRLSEADSARQLGDSLFILSKCPAYQFVSDAGAANHSEIKSLSSIALFNLYIRNYRKPDESKLITELSLLAKKYDYYPQYNYYTSDGPDYGGQWISKSFKTDIISGSIGNITERKYRWDLDNLPVFFRIFLYVSFIVTLLVFIFRHSTVKTFFLTILTGLLLLIISSLIIAFSKADELGMLAMIIFYLLLFAFISVTVFSNSNRNAVTGIAINLFTALITFAPLAIVALYYEINSWSDQFPTLPYDHPLYVAHREMVQTHIFMSEVLGFVLFAVLLPTLIHRLYRRWYALPEE